jgi:Protein of unknown function (DUF3467)
VVGRERAGGATSAQRSVRCRPLSRGIGFRSEVSDHEPGPPEDEPPQEPDYEIVLEPQHLAGVWANWARVSQTMHEFTLDFVRLDPTINKGIVVARVSVSPLFVTQLIEALRQEWAKYERRALPPEVYGKRDEPNDGQET